jgi:tetratricopeptide (TPR) repeat protein
MAVALTMLVGLPAVASPAPVKWSNDAKPWAPALLQIQARHRDLRSARLRIYADPDYRATVPHWQDRARAMVADLNQFVGPTFGVRFEIESLRRWEGVPHGASAAQALDRLEHDDPGQDVDWVLAFIPALPLLTTSQHEIGMARELGRHCVLRGMADVEEARALAKSWRLSDKERDQLYAVRKWHKEIAVFLHEWGHTLGAPHSRADTDVMSYVYSHTMTGFAPAELTAMDMAIDCRLGAAPTPAYRCPPLLAYLKQTDSEDWFGESRDSLLRTLESGLANTGEGVATSSASAEERRAWNAAVALLSEAEKLRDGGEAGKAVEVLERAATQAGALPSSGTPVWLAIAEQSIGLGALTDADKALGHSGSGSAVDEVRAHLVRTRRWYGLPAERVPAAAEPAYVQSFDALVKLKDHPDEALEKALASYPEAPGLLMLACESRLRAGRYRQARALCQTALDGFPELARAHYLLALAHLDEGRRADAATQLRQAIELAPEQRVHWEALGTVYRMAGQRDDLRALGAEYQKRFGARLP